MAIDTNLYLTTPEIDLQILSIRPTTANTSISETSHLTQSEIDLLPYPPSESQLPLGTCDTLATIKYDLKPECFQWKLCSYDLHLLTSKIPFLADFTDPLLLHDGPEEMIEDDDLLDRYSGDMILLYVFAAIIHRHRIDAIFPQQWKAINKQFLIPQLTVFVSDRFVTRSTKLKDYPTSGTVDICWVENKQCYQFSESLVLENIFRFRARDRDQPYSSAKTEQTTSRLNPKCKVKSSLLSNIRQKVYRDLARNELNQSGKRREPCTLMAIIQVMYNRLCMTPGRRLRRPMKK